MNDIDLEGAVLPTDNYNATFEGNGYTVKNFTVEKSGGTFIPKCAIFDTLGETAVIRNVSFTGVTYQFNNISDRVQAIKVSALAVSANGAATVTNVKIVGVIDTDYAGELPMLTSAFFEEKGGSAVITDFSAEITPAN